MIKCVRSSKSVNLFKSDVILIENVVTRGLYIWIRFPDNHIFIRLFFRIQSIFSGHGSGTALNKSHTVVDFLCSWSTATICIRRPSNGWLRWRSTLSPNYANNYWMTCKCPVMWTIATSTMHTFALDACMQIFKCDLLNGNMRILEQKCRLFHDDRARKKYMECNKWCFFWNKNNVRTVRFIFQFVWKYGKENIEHFSIFDDEKFYR